MRGKIVPSWSRLVLLCFPLVKMCQANQRKQKANANYFKNLPFVFSPQWCPSSTSTCSGEFLDYCSSLGSPTTGATRWPYPRLHGALSESWWPGKPTDSSCDHRHEAHGVWGYSGKTRFIVKWALSSPNSLTPPLTKPIDTGKMVLSLRLSYVSQDDQWNWFYWSW